MNSCLAKAGSQCLYCRDSTVLYTLAQALGMKDFLYAPTETINNIELLAQATCT